ncbi:MAG: DUF1211 domain-containing protein [Rhodothermaceae bacterium]|nr:DUF1211 domain-containing protein [Rhodothermaceae bacterium]
MFKKKEGHESSRLEAFSDAVFAFSATLLVVSLEVPDTFPELVSELKGFIAFGIRFGVLVALWTVHNAFFKRYPIADKSITFLNALFLFVILFYVYPLKFMTESIVAPLIGDSANLGMKSVDDLALLFILYSLGFVAVFGSVALMYLHVSRTSSSLSLSPLQSHEAGYFARHYGIFAGVGIISILFAFFNVGVIIGFPGYIYALLGPLCYWHGHRSEKKSKILRAQEIA